MFQEVVTRMLACPPLDYCCKICPDQFVGRLIDISGEFGDFPCRTSIENTSLPRNRVLLVLESPHRKEFICPIGPAKGLTGRLIRNHLYEILAPRILSSSDIFLINAIQYQCSLGYPPMEYRDPVFRQVWQEFGRGDFISRLKYISAGHEIFVVNACTKGKTLHSELLLRQLVEYAIVEALGRESDMRITHPASWMSPNNRRAFW